MEKLFLLYIIFINIIGFYFMFSDKSKAINKQWRISEKTLLFIALIGGSLGSLAGMYIFRHKTKHIKFTLGIPCIILLQLVILYYF